MSGRRRRWIWIAAIGGLLIGGWWVASAVGGGERRPEVEVERDDLVLGVEVTGTLAARETRLFGPPQIPDHWEFKISMMAPEGETVEEGAPVVSFDTADLEQSLLRQRAEAEQAAKTIEQAEKQLTMQRRDDGLRLAEAEARARKAELIVASPEELSEAHELATARLDLELARKELAYLKTRLQGSRRAAESRIAALRDQKRRAEEKVGEIEDGIERMTRKAEAAGTVIYVSDWRGDKKKVGDTCWIAEKVIELPDLNSMKADGKVDEADAGRLEERQKVTLRLDAHPDVRFEGTIGSIWRTVQRESWRNPLKVVRLEIDLLETDTQRMRPGMRFRGRIETERVEGALLVPVEAIFLTDDGPVVYRRTTFGYEDVVVELGRRNESRVEVLTGLSDGDSIALESPEKGGQA